MTTPAILKYLENKDPIQIERFLNFHCISGLVLHRYPQVLCDHKESLKKQFLRNWSRNIEIDKLLKEFSTSMPENIRPVILKGAALFEDIYPEFGSRPMCDIDFLVKESELESCLDWFASAGFKPTKIETWKGDNFKYIYQKNIGEEEIVLEIHTRLFWHVDDDTVLRRLVPSQYNGFFKLSLEENIVYLCGHLGFQHTLTKLSWFFDLYYIIEKNREQINWKRIEKLSNTMKLKSSTSIVLWVLNQFYFEEKIVSYPIVISKNLKSKLTLDFLWMDVRPKWPYYLLKHGLKDSIYDAIKYDLLWILNKIKKILVLKYKE